MILLSLFVKRLSLQISIISCLLVNWRLKGSYIIVECFIWWLKVDQCSILSVLRIIFIFHDFAYDQH